MRRSPVITIAVLACWLASGLASAAGPSRGDTQRFVNPGLVTVEPRTGDSDSPCMTMLILDQAGATIFATGKPGPYRLVMLDPQGRYSVQPITIGGTPDPPVPPGPDPGPVPPGPVPPNPTDKFAAFSKTVAAITADIGRPGSEAAALADIYAAAATKTKAGEFKNRQEAFAWVHDQGAAKLGDAAYIAWDDLADTIRLGIIQLRNDKAIDGTVAGQAPAYSAAADAIRGAAKRGKR